MAEAYNIFLSIAVVKESTQAAEVEEEYRFNNQSFAKMANLADEFYELVAKLQKLK